MSWTRSCRSIESPAGSRSCEDAIFYRGHSRILLVSPGWKSVCVPAGKADKMSDKELVALWNKVNGPMIKDRHDNP